MLIAVSLILVGFVLLTISAEYTVMGSVAIANKLKIPTLIVGLTIVAFGTSAPEFVVSIKAAFEGASGIALGNIVGSNITNIAFILGLAALIHPILSKKPVFSFDYLMLFFVSALFLIFCLMGELVLWHGIVFILIMAGFIYFNYQDAKVSGEDPEDAVSSIAEKKWWFVIAVTALGFIGIIYGSDILVTGAVDLARLLGVSETIIGLTIIALGTSLPELATSVMAAIRKQNDVALGNIVGSNIWNILFIIGASASFVNIDVPVQLIRYDLWVMLGVAVFFMFLVWRQRKVSRAGGLALIFIYIVYIISQILMAKGIFSIE
ncbi:MAG: calcium/sodium antiporter [Lactobacillaceae bacterium]|jgi:cation:H+ antiporter|nr:calcium/sodium antiporter [Lactobacillaceae bacterium]